MNTLNGSVCVLVCDCRTSSVSLTRSWRSTGWTTTPRCSSSTGPRYHATRYTLDTLHTPHTRWTRYTRHTHHTRHAVTAQHLVIRPGWLDECSPFRTTGENWMKMMKYLLRFSEGSWITFVWFQVLNLQFHIFGMFLSDRSFWSPRGFCVFFHLLSHRNFSFVPPQQTSKTRRAWLWSL